MRGGSLLAASWSAAQRPDMPPSARADANVWMQEHMALRWTAWLPVGVCPYPSWV
jgi:hypothetical protein